MTAAADRHLLFGLLALQNGIISQVQLVAAFQAWTLDRSRSLADHLEARGDLTGAKRALLEALAAVHLDAHGGDVEKSLAAVSAGKSTKESLARIGDPEIDATLGHVGSARGSTEDGDTDRTASYSVGSATSDGQRFRVLRPHARGGLGAVFVALDAELNREVALKQILDHHADDPTSRQRFLIEAEITGGLEHPGIVPVYGLGTYGDGRPYYAMRFIRGDSLKEAIEQFHGEEARQGRPGPAVARAAQAPAAVHRRLQRDRLRPQPRRAAPRHQAGQHHRRQVRRDAGRRLGPGQAAGPGRAGARPRRADAGAELGQRQRRDAARVGDGHPGLHEPRAGPRRARPARPALRRLQPRRHALLPPDRQAAVRRRRHRGGLATVQRGDFPPPRKLDPSIDRALEAVCLKAMAQRPEDRYDSCKALADDIERWMADEPVIAWKEPWTRKLVRWLTRHRTGVTAAGAAMLMAVVGLGAVSGVQARANGELNRSNDALSAANARVVQANLQLKEANENVTRANGELKAANVREHERFDLAMEAIKLFHGDISKDLLLKQKQFETLRAQIAPRRGRFLRQARGTSQGSSRQAIAGGARPRLRGTGAAHLQHRRLPASPGRVPEGSQRPPPPQRGAGRRRRDQAGPGAAPSARTENCWRG